MLTPKGCTARRRRLMERLDPAPDWAIIADPRHLMYLANFPVEPFSWASPPPGLLLIERGGASTLVTDNLAARRMKTLWVDRVLYAKDPRQIRLRPWPSRLLTRRFFTSFTWIDLHRSSRMVACGVTRTW